MKQWNSRTELLVGAEGAKRLAAAHVLVVGIGGVGGYAVEVLARAGVGRFTIVDGDTFEATNLNRQLFSLHSTLGMPKVAVAKARLLDINPTIGITAIHSLLHDEALDALVAQPYDLIVDAIDTPGPKVHLIRGALEMGTPLVSSMGCGGRRAADAVRVTSLWEVKGDPLAALVRRRLRRLGASGDCRAVWSSELPDKSACEKVDGEPYKRTRVGVISYMPALFGTHAAAAGIEILLAGGETATGNIAQQHNSR